MSTRYQVLPPTAPVPAPDDVLECRYRRLYPVSDVGLVDRTLCCHRYLRVGPSAGRHLLCRACCGSRPVLTGQEPAVLPAG